VSLLPWHTSLAERLERQIEQDRLPHAILICGNPGWGEERLAQWLAVRLLGVDEARPLNSVAHPDLRVVEPDGAVIKVDQIRELNEFAVGKPQAASAKVAVVARAERMNVNAQNALLKSLEEPPPATHLVLTSGRLGRLLPTIRSRCQQYAIAVDAALARDWFEGQQGNPELLDDYGGAPLTALAASEMGEVPLTALLPDAAGDAGAAVARVLEQDSVRLAGRWQARMLQHMRGTRPLAILEAVTPRQQWAFMDELMWFSRNIESATSQGEKLLVERLLARWQTLISRTS
jgi:hypothetical protein|tara:strand:- start:1233 stop:2102 length:870 start_codon:yes stop_codon:yes gene_type:complete